MSRTDISMEEIISDWQVMQGFLKTYRMTPSMMASSAGALWTALNELLPKGKAWRDGTMDHMPGVKRAREVLETTKTAVRITANTGDPVTEYSLPVRYLVHALERSAANTDTDWRWLAACALRECPEWQTQTILMP